MHNVNMSCISMLVVMFHLLFLLHQPSNLEAAYIFGIMLHNPIPDDLALHHQQQQQQQQHQHQHQHQHQQNNKTPAGGEMMSAEDPLAATSRGLERQPHCSQDSDCINDNAPDGEPLMYCDRHYGRCDFFRQADELCRHDSQCDNGLQCMFGRCAQPAAAGHQGARCNEAADCNAGLCCARQHGEKICKPRLSRGQTCFVPSGGLEYSLNELCPCDVGLECRPVLLKNKRKRHFKSETLMKCSRSELEDTATTTT